MATRQIRARTGQLEDPLPEGKKLEEKEFPKITPVKRDGDVDPEVSKDDIMAHKEELKHMQGKDPKHGGEPNSLSKHGGDNINSKANTMSGSLKGRSLPKEDIETSEAPSHLLDVISAPDTTMSVDWHEGGADGYATQKHF